MKRTAAKLCWYFSSRFTGRALLIAAAVLTAWNWAASHVPVAAQETATTQRAGSSRRLTDESLAESFDESLDNVSLESVSLESTALEAAGAPCQCEACRAKGATAPTPGCPLCCHGRAFSSGKIPGSVAALQRTGNFPILPTGPGYFSLWDRVTGHEREKAPKSGYPSFLLMPQPFFDADFRYVDSLSPEERTWVERLKRMRVNDCWEFSTGGQFWIRYMNEQNARLTDIVNDYTLSRVRVFGDVHYSDWMRVYGEFLWSEAFSLDLPALPTDANRGDILNLFVDVKLWDWDGHGVYARGGRQELYFGSQRLVSGLDWVNTRRTFEGFRVFRQGEEWDFDLFAVEPVPVLRSDLDRADHNVQFAGSWVTYRPKKGEAVDFYYLYFDNNNSLLQQAIVRSPTEFHTFGSRWSGDQNGYLWDFEGALQLGDRGDADLVAGMTTAGLGRHWKDAWLTPTAWVYYDFASGDASPNSGSYTTFHQLYPFGHYYLGWADLVGRQNIQDANAHLYLYPAPWVTLFAQYHHFWLNQSRDALYGPSGLPIRRDPTGQAGTNVGDEIDLVANFHLDRYSDILLCYSHLFGGRFLEATAGPGRAADAEAVYMSYQRRW